VDLSSQRMDVCLATSPRTGLNRAARGSAVWMRDGPGHRDAY
jgi:hypothetical protein